MERNDIDTVNGYIRNFQQILPMDNTFYTIPIGINTITASFYAKYKLLENVPFIWVHLDVWKLFHSWYGGGPELRRKVFHPVIGGVYTMWKDKRGPFICVNPVYIKLRYCNSNTGKIDKGMDEIREYPPDYTVKQIAEDIVGVQYEPKVHLYFKLGEIKQLYLLNTWKKYYDEGVRVTIGDLDKNIIDSNKLVEFPDDRRHSMTIDDIEWIDNNMEIVIEKRNEDKTWPMYMTENDDNDEWRDNIGIGDMIDVYWESATKWFESVVLLRGKGVKSIIVRAVGYRNYNKEVRIDDLEQIAKRYTHSKGTHRSRYL